MLCAPREAIALQNGLTAAAAAVNALLSRHGTGTATVQPATLLIEHADTGIGTHRTRIRHNGTFGVFEAVWFGAPTISTSNLYLGEADRLSTIVTRALEEANALPEGVRIDAKTRSLLAEADRICADTFPA